MSVFMGGGGKRDPARLVGPRSRLAPRETIRGTSQDLTAVLCKHSGRGEYPVPHGVLPRERRQVLVRALL